MSHETPWGTYMVFEVSSAEPDADPVWVDLTDRVLDIGRDLETWLGRDSELDQPEPGGMTVQLRNRDDALTPGNPTSPYPWFKQARRFRVREMIGYLGFDLADGYLEIPEVQIRTQDPDDAESDITLSVTAVDILGRLQNARKFTSTLAEHIRFNAGPSLHHYWPLNDPTTPWLPAIGSQSFGTTTVDTRWGDPTASEGTAKLTPAAVDGPRGDDVQFPLYEMRIETISGFRRPTRYMVTSVEFPDGTVTVAAGQVMTVVFWVKRSSVVMDSEVLTMLVNYFQNPTDGVMALVVQDTDFTWLCEVTGATSASFVGPTAPTERWTAVALRWGFGPNVIEVWTDEVQTVGTLSFAPASSARIDKIYLPEGWFAGSLAHVQLYIGSANDWTFEDFTAQRRVGLEGFDRQTTGERINTVLDFAGFPAGRRDIDAGRAVMQPLSLAGKRPLDPLEEAVETEQGRLFAERGRVVFHDRVHIHDV